MNWKTWSLLILALVAGFAAAFGVKSIFFVEHAPQATDESAIPGLKEQLLVANGDLSSGTELSALNVRLTLTPEDKVPRDGIFSFNGVAGRKISRDLSDGEPISLYDLEEFEQEEEVSAGFVPPGCSIVPIEISSATKENGNRNYLKTTKLNKMIKNGDSVDVIVVKEVPAKSGLVALPRLATETLVENVPVFSVTDESRFGSDGVVRTSSISTLLTTDQLEKIREASEDGKIRVLLHGDSGNAEGEPSTNLMDSVPTAFDSRRYPAFEKDRFNNVPQNVATEDADIDLNQSFIIDFSADASSVETADSKSDSRSNDFINNDFTIELDGETPDVSGVSDSDDVDLSNNAGAGEVAKWNTVDFDSKKTDESSESSSLQDSLWLGPNSFRSRNGEELVPSEQADQYTRVASEDPVTDVADDESETAVEESALSVPVEVESSSESAKTPAVTNVKKYSPFITVKSKRSKSGS